MSCGKKYRDRAWLHEQYVEQAQTVADIAEECDCGESTVSRWLDTHGIDARSAPPSPYPRLTDSEWLHEQYIKERQSTQKIAEEVGCATSIVCKWLDRHDIETRKRGSYQLSDHRIKDPEWLREQYVEKGLTGGEIAKKCDCTSATVMRWVNRHNIETRTAGPRPPDSRLADSGWLRKKYVKQRNDSREIASLCDCNPDTVLAWLDRHGIETRQAAPQAGLPGEDNPNWNGGKSRYGPGWNDTKRKKVRERDGRVCQAGRCSVTEDEHLDKYGEKLHVHHLRKARDIDDPQERNAPGNLITLCRDCHSRWEKIADVGLVPEVKR